VEGDTGDEEGMMLSREMIERNTIILVPLDGSLKSTIAIIPEEHATKYIYFIDYANGVQKIGITSNLNQRFGAYVHSATCEFKHLWFEHHHTDAETILLHHFERYLWKGNEWFKIPRVEVDKFLAKNGVCYDTERGVSFNDLYTRTPTPAQLCGR